MTSQDRDTDKLLTQPSPSAKWTMDDVLRALANGEITRERAFAQLMALHELSTGAAVNALRHLDPTLAQQFAEQVGMDLASSAKRLSKTEFEVEVPIHDHGATERFRNKSPLVLQREYLLFKALTKGNQEVPSATLLKLVTSFDADIKGPAVTAHLDRLFKDGLISRKRKGLYGTTLQSRGYLKALIAELEARGVGLPSEY